MPKPHEIVDQLEQLYATGTHSWSLQEKDGNEIGYLEELTLTQAKQEAQQTATNLNKTIYIVPTSARIALAP